MHGFFAAFLILNPDFSFQIFLSFIAAYFFRVNLPAGICHVAKLNHLFIYYRFSLFYQITPASIVLYQRQAKIKIVLIRSFTVPFFE
jgi:hypothetical protein